MIIGVDGNEANVENKVGVSIYALELLNYFHANARKDLSFVIFLRHSPMSHMPTPSGYFTYKVVTGPTLWSQVFLPLALFKNKLSSHPIDVFFTPAHYGPRVSPVPTVVTVHDLSYFLYPNEFLKKDLIKLKNWTGYSVKNASQVIVVSKTTKKDLLKYYSCSEEKVSVVYNGYEKNSKTERATLPCIQKHVKHPFVLYVGTLQPRKNISTLLRAFQKFNTLNPEYRLILAGKKGWMFGKIFEEAESMDISDNITFTGYISDEKLICLYKKAYCLVMPSFYEGFGLPLLEAMSYGCPVISSFTSSLPEIGNNACLYFDPNVHEELVEKLLQLKVDSTLRKKLISDGRRHVKNFSWSTCGMETLNIIKGVVSTN